MRPPRNDGPQAFTSSESGPYDVAEYAPRLEIARSARKTELDVVTRQLVHHVPEMGSQIVAAGLGLFANRATGRRRGAAVAENFVNVQEALAGLPCYFPAAHSRPSRSGWAQSASGAAWGLPVASNAKTVPDQCAASVSSTPR